MAKLVVITRSITEYSYPLPPDLAMLAHRYQVWSWGQEVDGGQEDCVKYHAGLTVVAKRHRYEKYEVFNELACMHLGRYLGLPIPAGFVLEKDGEPYFCSSHIGFSESEFPPADLQHLALNHPRMTCGAALFDAWVCNSDRHAGNVFYDSDEGTIFFIDHGMAILNSNGPSHLRQNKERIILREEFIRPLQDLDSFGDWMDRLLSIPERMIIDTMRDAASVGVDDVEAIEAANLLVERRRLLPKLFQSHEHLFPSKKDSLFSPFTPTTYDDDSIDYTI